MNIAIKKLLLLSAERRKVREQSEVVGFLENPGEQEVIPRLRCENQTRNQIILKHTPILELPAELRKPRWQGPDWVPPPRGSRTLEFAYLRSSR